MANDIIHIIQHFFGFFLFQKKEANVIEFGSGRGLMSYWMAKASQLEAGQKFILVDKASHRWFSVGTCKYKLGYKSHNLL